MEYLFSKCRGKRTVLIKPADILDEIAKSKPHFEITAKQLETHMKNIVLDGFIDTSLTNNREGEIMYVVTLTTRGEAFKRERDEAVKRRIRDIAWRILLTAIASVVGIIIGKILG